MVSVVIPAYNVSQFIAETVKSVLGQTFTDFELLIINDGSPDTDALDLALAPYMDRIRYFRQKNSGAAAARNEGIRNAKGEWIAFLDGDDLWDPQFLESQIAAANRESLDFIYCDMHCFGPGVHPHTSFATHSPSDGPVTAESLLSEKCTVLTSTVLVRREAVVAAGLFETSLRWGEDFDLWMRLGLRGYRMGYQKSILGRRRIHSQALTADTTSLLEGLLRAYDNVERSPGFPQDLLPLLNQRRFYYTQEVQEVRFKKCLLHHEGRQARQHYKNLDKNLATVQHSAFLSFLCVLSYVPPLASGTIRLHAHLSHFREGRARRKGANRRG